MTAAAPAQEIRARACRKCGTAGVVIRRSWFRKPQIVTCTKCNGLGRISEGLGDPKTAEQVRAAWLAVPLIAALSRTRLPVLIGLAILAAFAVPLILKAL